MSQMTACCIICNIFEFFIAILRFRVFLLHKIEKALQMNLVTVDSIVTLDHLISIPFVSVGDLVFNQKTFLQNPQNVERTQKECQDMGSIHPGLHALTYAAYNIIYSPTDIVFLSFHFHRQYICSTVRNTVGVS